MRTPKRTILLFVEHFNAANIAALNELYSKDAVVDSKFTCAKMDCIIETIFEEGSHVVLEWRDSSGLRGCEFFHVVNEKIVFQRGYRNELNFLKQQISKPHSMRRSEREIIAPEFLREVITTNNAAVVSMTDGTIPYAVMLNYAPQFENDNIKIIFHCAREGRKLDCLRRNPAVSIFINDSERTKIINGGTQSSHWTTQYRSVIISGLVNFVENPTEKRIAAERFMHHYNNNAVDLPEMTLDAVMFFEVTAETVSGKQNPGVTKKLY